MKIEDARAFAQALLAACDAAQAAGQTEVALDPFVADDDAARTELDDAIAQAKARTPGGQR